MQKELREATKPEEATRKFLIEQYERATKLRSEDREFLGLEREFFIYQKQMLTDYDNSKDINTTPRLSF